MSYRLESTEKTPEISIDNENGIFSIKGVSVPDNPYQFYADMLEAIDTYVEQPKEQTELNFKLDYFNTSTALVIRNLLRKLEPISSKSNLKIKWYYQLDDEDMEEAGCEFQYLFRDLDFELLGVN